MRKYENGWMKENTWIDILPHYFIWLDVHTYTFVFMGSNNTKDGTIGYPKTLFSTSEQ